MLKYCLKCKKDTESVISKVLKTKNGRSFWNVLIIKCTVWVEKNQNL